MATLKDIQTKIGAVKKTRQITKAMNMVAASKLRGAQRLLEAFRPYSSKFAQVLGSLAEKAGEEANALLTPREDVKKINIILCTSDRGLCGGFNFNLIKKAENLLKAKSEQRLEVSFTNFGKKGRDWCRSTKLSIDSEHLGIVGGRFNFNIAAGVGQQILDAFTAGDYDEVYIIYSEFGGMSKQTPIIKQLLPIPPLDTGEEQEEQEEQAFQAEHICEPGPDELLGEMLPRSVFVQIYSALLEISTSEHAARMSAMNNATTACNDMIDNLSLVYNKARQAAITADLMDIVGGAEALKG